MAKAVQKTTLSASRDIPFNKLVLSQSNVRRLKAGVSIEELAEDIARRTLLQSLSVRPVLDAEGAALAWSASSWAEAVAMNADTTRLPTSSRRMPSWRDRSR
jgi:hypothetical protein